MPKKSVADKLLTGAAFKRLQLQVMARMVSAACERPRVALTATTHEARLEEFGRLSARRAAEAAASPDGGAAARAALISRAYILGRALARALAPLGATADTVATALYANIGIELQPRLPQGVTVPRCAFCAWYSPEQCAFMSAFDRGILTGLVGAGAKGAELEFSARLTEGAAACEAALVMAKTMEAASVAAGEEGDR